MLLELTRADGGVSLLRVVKGATQDAVDKWAVTHGAPAAVREIKETDIPSDRTFRDAWVPGLTVDMPKARDIHMGRIRSARDVELAKQDLEYIKADERGDAAEKARVATRKQALRDIPQTFDLSGASDPDTLKALWPADLPK